MLSGGWPVAQSAQALYYVLDSSKEFRMDTQHHSVCSFISVQFCFKEFICMYEYCLQAEYFSVAA
jgi:hypothetical protein